jgi:hypothetical protein
MNAFNVCNHSGCIGVVSVEFEIMSAALKGCAVSLCRAACCSKIAEAEAAVSVNEKKWLVMHMHVQLRLDELWAPPNPWLTVT